MQWKMVALATFGAVAACGHPYGEGESAPTTTSAATTPSGAKSAAGDAPVSKPSADPSAASTAPTCPRALTTTCTPASDTPLYAANAAERDGNGVSYDVTELGGQAWLGAPSTPMDGYSAVVTWPSQPAVLTRPEVRLSTIVGMDLDGFTIENGWGMAEAEGADACTGSVYMNIYQVNPSGGETLIVSQTSPAASFCQADQKLQFKGERDGTTWIFSYRIVGAGQDDAFIEQARHDFGAELPGQGYVYAATTMLDYDGTVEKIAPITFGPILMKTDAWHPADRMTSYDTAGSERLLVRPNPELVGLTTSVAGASCYPSTGLAIGTPLWDATDACYPKQVSCDPTSGACH